MAQISVIVAIYNVEDYLIECLESIIRQTYQDLEIILVDDGSPDSCPMICDRYAQKDSRIRVIHQKNQGSVMARYNGLQIAKSKYVSFIDGDDWLEDNMYEEMFKLAESCEADIVITGFKMDSAVESHSCRNKIESGIYTGNKLQELLSRALFDGYFYEFGVSPALWCKLFRRDIIARFEHPHPFIKRGEDAVITYPAMAQAKKIIIDNEKKLYHYRIVNNSMSRAFDGKGFERVIYLMTEIKKRLNKDCVIQKSLLYYGLYMSVVEIGRSLSRMNEKSILSKKKDIEDFRNKFLSIDWEDDEINWSLFPIYSRFIMKCFLQGNIGMMIIINYIYKGCCMMKNL